jgi:predicted dehydrogenase/threonine dehydrogenase-like Zn-dependent dehydrogenase
MRQVLQSLGEGQTILADVPAPQTPRGGLLIRTTRSLISAGTERMLVDFSRAGWIDRVRQQPDKVKQVLEKIRTDGLLPTIEAVRSSLGTALPLGYCNVGVVEATGSGVRGFAPGTRVVSNGPHAECVAVPRNLCAQIPDAVTDDEAAFTVLGAIALQGLRLAAPTLGERFVVTGLGLIGLITVQLLRANGCRVLGIDPDPAKRAIARSFGAEVVAIELGEDPISAANVFSNGEGMDGVLITAATSSNEPVAQGAQVCRKRGRIVLVGVVGLELNRADFYHKEISFQVSCSYGPGRYDPEYEEKGNDYPLGFVRWTEQRNFEAVLAMMQSRAIDVRPLITHRFAFDSVPAAYDLLATGKEPYLGILIEYRVVDPAVLRQTTVVLDSRTTRTTKEEEGPGVSFVGAGNYAGRVLISAFAAGGARLRGIASSGGVTASHYGRKYNFARATSDSNSLIGSEDSDAIVIATRHDSHSRFVVQALAAGKHVFVEKPLAITLAQVEAIADAWSSSGPSGSRPLVMVGFNRRFAPQVQQMKTLLAGLHEPKTFVMTVNAGAIPLNHWTQDPNIGGGRIVGEGCHFIDLMRFLAGHRIVEARVQALGGGANGSKRDDVSIISMAFADGSLGTINYLANGHKDVPKERLEVFCAGRILQLDNFRKLQTFGWGRSKTQKLWRQDKGQNACARAFIDAVKKGGAAPIAFDEILEVARVSIALGEAARI